MTTIEWARQYPEIAEKLFGCKVEELELLLARRASDTADDGAGYMTSADKAKLDDILKGENYGSGCIREDRGFGADC